MSVLTAVILKSTAAEGCSL